MKMRDFSLQRQKSNQNGPFDILFVEFYRFTIPIRPIENYQTRHYIHVNATIILSLFFFISSVSGKAERNQSGSIHDRFQPVHAQCVPVDRCYYSYSTIFNPATIMHTVTSRHRLK